MSNIALAVERVQRGVKWLDKNAPGWREDVDPDDLDIASAADCILGQVYGELAEKHMRGGYSLAVYASGRGYRWAVDHGFTDDEHASFSVLQQLWLGVLLPEDELEAA